MKLEFEFLDDDEMKITLDGKSVIARHDRGTSVDLNPLDQNTPGREILSGAVSFIDFLFRANETFDTGTWNKASESTLEDIYSLS